MLPLNYAILKAFLYVDEADCATIMDILADDYKGFRAYTAKSIDGSLSTAEKNLILEESRYDLDENGNLRVFYRITPDGRSMVEKYIGA